MSHMPQHCLPAEIPAVPEPASTGAPESRPPSSSRDSASAFDTMETKFFKEGDDLSIAGGEDPSDAPPAVEPPKSGGWDEVTVVVARRRRKGRLASYLALIAAGFAACAVLAGWHVRRSAAAASLPESVPTAAPASLPEPAPALAPVYVPPAEPIPAPAAPQSDESEASPPRAAAGTLPPETNSPAIAACKRAFDQHGGKAVLAECGRAFAADPQSAEIAVMLAKTEFDRGHFRPALDWARKALALDQNQADAYVFVGGAEQAAGHLAAARTAYKHYLQLSPKGRYATDLRRVLGSL